MEKKEKKFGERRSKKETRKSSIFSNNGVKCKWDAPQVCISHAPWFCLPQTPSQKTCLKCSVSRSSRVQLTND